MNTLTQESQSGSALIVSLILLVLLTIIGVSAMQTTTMQEAMSGNTKEQHRSFHAAELGLRRAEEAASGTANCGSNFVASVLDTSEADFTNLPATGDELAARFHSDFCGPMTRELTYSGDGASSDRGGQKQIMMQYYTVVSVGEVPGNSRTQLVSTVAKQ